MARIYYCDDCRGTVEFKNGENCMCECGRIFGKKINNTKDHINMRTTWSGTTKLEFSETTIDKDIAERNAR